MSIVDDSAMDELKDCVCQLEKNIKESLLSLDALILSLTHDIDAQRRSFKRHHNVSPSAIDRGEITEDYQDYLEEILADIRTEYREWRTKWYSGLPEVSKE